MSNLFYNQRDFETTRKQELYGNNPTKRDTRRFNRYLKSDIGQKDALAFTKAESDAYLKSMDAVREGAIQRMRDAAANFKVTPYTPTSTTETPAQSVSSTPAQTTSNTVQQNPPVKPVLSSRSEAEWNRIASEATNGKLKTMADVEARQRANGFSEDQIDGKFGNYSKEYFKNHNLGKYQINQTPSIPTAPVLPSASTPSTQVETPKFSLDAFASTNNLTDFRNFNGKRVVRYDPMGRGDWFIDEEGKTYWANGIGTLGDPVESDYKKYIPEIQRRFDTLQGMITASYQKQGGTMNRINYFQQGGAVQQQDMQQQVIALVQAAMQGDQKATETVNQIMEAAKAGDQQAMQIAQMIQQVAQQMQGQATAAKYGAKLNYLQALKCGGKTKAKKKEQGGKVCPECEKQLKQTRKPLITKHQQGKTLDYNKATRFYNKWTPEEITKLQMFLSNTDKLGDAAYTGEWGKMNKETLDAIAAYQTKHKLTGDGMWGFWTDQVHGVMDNATLNKGSYTADYNNKHEQGDLLALPTSFSYTKLSDLSNKQVQDAVNYYMSYPDLLYSDDPQHAKWRQIFHNSGKDGADFLNQAYGALTPEEREKIDAKKTTKSHKIAEVQESTAKGMTRAAEQLLPALTMPVALATGLPVVASGSIPGIVGLATSIGGTFGGAEIGKRRGAKKGAKNWDKTYVDDTAARYGVASSVIDPKRRIREGAERGTKIGGLIGGVTAGVAGTAATAAAEGAMWNNIGYGRGLKNYPGKVTASKETLSAYGYDRPGPIKGVSEMDLFKKGLTTPAQFEKGITRTGGLYGGKYYVNGKVHNPGTPILPEEAMVLSETYNSPTAPLHINFGGPQGTGVGVKIGQMYSLNPQGVTTVGGSVSPMGILATDAVTNTQPQHPVRLQKRVERKEERKEKRQERQKKAIKRTAESTTD